MASFVEQATLSVKDNSSAQIKKINAELKKLFDTAKSLRSTTVDIKIKDSGVKQALTQIKELKKELGTLKNARVNINVSASSLTKAASAAKSLTRSLETLRGQSQVTLRVSAPGLQQVKTQLAQVRQAASRPINVRTPGVAPAGRQAAGPLARAQTYQSRATRAAGSGPTRVVPGVAPAPRAAPGPTRVVPTITRAQGQRTQPWGQPAGPSRVAPTARVPTAGAPGGSRIPATGGGGGHGLTGGIAHGLGSGIGGTGGNLIAALDKTNAGFWAVAAASHAAAEALKGIVNAGSAAARSQLQLETQASPAQQKILTGEAPEGVGPIRYSNAQRKSIQTSFLGNMSGDETQRAVAAKKMSDYLEKDTVGRFYAENPEVKDSPAAAAGMKQIVQAVDMLSSEMTDAKGDPTERAKEVLEAYKLARAADPDITPQLFKATAAGLKSAGKTMSGGAISSALITAGSGWGSKVGNQNFQAIQSFGGFLNNAGLNSKLRELGLIEGGTFVPGKKGTKGRPDKPGKWIGGEAAGGDMIQKDPAAFLETFLRPRMDEALKKQGKDPEDTAAQAGYLMRTFSMARNTAMQIATEMMTGRDQMRRSKEQGRTALKQDSDKALERSWPAQKESIKTALTDAGAGLMQAFAEKTNLAENMGKVAKAIQENPNAALAVGGAATLGLGAAGAAAQMMAGPIGTMAGIQALLNPQTAPMGAAALLLQKAAADLSAAATKLTGGTPEAPSGWGNIAKTIPIVNAILNEGQKIQSEYRPITEEERPGLVKQYEKEQAQEKLSAAVARLAELEAQQRTPEAQVGSTGSAADVASEIATLNTTIGVLTAKVAGTERTPSMIGGMHADVPGTVTPVGPKGWPQLPLPTVPKVEVTKFPDIGSFGRAAGAAPGGIAPVGAAGMAPGGVRVQPVSVVSLPEPIGKPATGTGGVAMGTPGAPVAPTGGIKPVGPAGWGTAGGTGAGDLGLSLQTAANTMLSAAAPYTAAATAFQAAGPTFQAAVQAGASSITEAGTSLTTSLSGVGPILTAAGQTAGQSISAAGETLTTSLSGIGPMLSAAGQAAGAAMTAAASTFQSTFASAAATLSTAGATAAAALSGAAPGIGAAIGNAAANSIRSSVSNLSISVNANVKSTSSGGDTGSQKAAD